MIGRPDPDYRAKLSSVVRLRLQESARFWQPREIIRAFL